MAQKYTESKKASNRKWDAANLDRLSIALPKGQGDAIKSHAATRGESVNGFIGRAISETMDRDAVASQESREFAPSTAVHPTEGTDTQLPPDVLLEASEGAARTGEEVPAFLRRAVKATRVSDSAALAVGEDPAAKWRQREATSQQSEG